MLPGVPLAPLFHYFSFKVKLIGAITLKSISYFVVIEAKHIRLEHIVFFKGDETSPCGFPLSVARWLRLVELYESCS